MNTTPLARILIVDDEAALMRALCDTLRDQGYETEGFTTGDDALKALQAQPFDLLLTDLMMPGMDGVALLGAALKIDPLLVGILMTGMGTIETAVQAMQAGALDYILKPFKVSAILPVLSRAVSVRRLRLENLELRDTLAIHELNQAIAYTLDPNVLLDKIANAALAQFEADEASIMLLSDDGLFLHVAAVHGGRHDVPLGTRVPVGEGIAGWVAAHREPLVLQGDVGARQPAPLHPRADIQSALSMPMITRNRLIGVINVNCTRKRRAFALGQIKVLSIFTNAAAAGIEAARLYKRLREREAHLNFAQKKSHTGGWDLDLVDHTVRSTPEHDRIFGYDSPPLQWTFEIFLEHVLAEDRAEVNRRFHEATSANTDWNFEFRIRRRDGEVRWVWAAGEHQGDAAGPARRMVGIVQDITERKHAEQEILDLNADLERRVAERTAELLQAREVADAANRAKSAFLATMSHEIRTPMNGVIGMVEVLAHSPLPEHQADAVRTIRKSALSLLGIIDDILDFSKIEAGRLELERAPVALGELIESVCATLTQLASDKNVQLNLFIDPRLPAQIWFDATRLRQVLINLAGNAIKFSADQENRRGQVMIRAELAEESPASLVLCVRDNGVGIAPETLPRLFSSFTQAESSTTRRFGGTGLGLAICQRLVTLMNGEIEVLSTLGQGSSFIITLPLEAVREAVPEAAPDLGGLDCIVIGSNIEADTLRVYLTHAGARVHLVADLEEASRCAHGRARVVVIHNTLRDGPPAEMLCAAFGPGAGVGHLLIARGKRRRARLAAPDMVTLDANCLRRLVLLRAVAVAAGLAAPDALHESPGDEWQDSQIVAPTISEARAQGRLILIAEDDEVNQKVILSQIELLGYAAEVANNGSEALRLWRAGHYALLLTDLHMPDMDGYTLTETIRREELERGMSRQERMPILALTANALRGEARRAQAVGMDEYLTKPLQLHLLKAALVKWMQRDEAVTATGERPELPGTAPVGPALDLAVLRGLVGSDAHTVREVLCHFRKSLTQLASDLRVAQANGDRRQIGAIAHRLKSSSRSVGALALADRCVELENASRAGAAEDWVQGVSTFEAELRLVEVELDALLAQA